MVKKKAAVDDVIAMSKQTNRKTQELLERASELHGIVAATHERASQLHQRLGEQRHKAQQQREAKRDPKERHSA